MKTKLVNRYYCDFCKKSGGSASAMARHEKHCTMNPNRECRVCNYVDSTNRAPLSELLAILPQEPKEKCSESYRKFYDTVDEVFPALREAAGDCPGCILAALRQCGAGPMAAGFDFRNEMRVVWENINAARLENGY